MTDTQIILRKLSKIEKLLKKPVPETSEWIYADEAARRSGYSKESLRKMELKKNYKVGKLQYNVQELTSKNLI